MFACRVYRLLFSLILSCAALPAWGLGSNVALLSNGATASASSTYNASYPVTAVNDGDRKGLRWGSGGGWNDATARQFPDWVQITFNGVKRIDEIHLFGLQANFANPVEPTANMVSPYVPKNFEVQYWNGISWVAIPGGSVVNNALVARKFSFSALSTDRIRVYITSAARYSRLVEIEAYEAVAPTNLPPVVTLTAPLNNAGFTAPATLTFAANASDNDGIAKVEFYNGTTLVGSDDVQPFGYTWNNVPAGVYSLSAKAYDKLGASTGSTPINVTVLPAAPSVNLNIAPTSITSGTSATLTWSSTNATSCVASGAWSGNKATSGTQSTGVLIQTSTFTLTCTGPGGSANQTKTVTINPPAGSTTVSGTVDSSLIANLKQNAIYVFAGNVTPDDLGGTGAQALKVVAVTQNKAACAWGFNAGPLSDGQYTLAFTNQAATDNPSTDDALTFQRVAVLNVEGGTLSYKFPATRVLTVGPGKNYPDVMAAAAAAQTGDVIEIDAGQYDDNIVVWRASDLTLRGVNGRAHMRATKLIPYTPGNDLENGKGLWVTRAANIKVENIEFSGARVPDKNGAGIRAEGANLSVCNGYFHDNETGILGGAAEMLIEYSEFANNGGCTVGAGCAHNLYIINADKLVFRHNYSHHANIGHLLKTRAKENHILYNRLTGETGTASYEVDIPDGGLTYLIGNLIQQGAQTDNSTMVAYAAESASNPIQQLYAVNNTLVNENGSGAAISIRAGTTAQVINNLFVGNGTAVSGSATQISNLTTNAPNFVNQATYDYRLTSVSPGINSGSEPGTSSTGFALSPNFQYSHPSNREARTAIGSLDIGAYEFAGNQPTPAPLPTLTLQASPAVVSNGGSSTLTWSSTGVASCTASGAWSGGKAASGSQTLANLTASGTYTLNCTGSGGSIARSTTVTVNPASSNPLIIGETAILGDNDSGNGGLLLAQQTALPTSATIQSLSFYVTTASGDLRLGIYDATGPGGGPGAKRAETNSLTPVAGWNTVNVITPVLLPAGTYWLAYMPSSSNLGFKMEPTGSAKWYAYPYGPMPATFSTAPTSGPYHWSLYATFNSSSTPSPVPTVALSANPVTLNAGGSATLTWASTNATSCTASGAWSGTQPISGSQVLNNVVTTGTYTLSCTGIGGSASKSVTVTVSPNVPAPTVSLNASPANVANGGTSTLTWSSTNATSCTAGGAWSGNKTTSGSQSTGPLSASSTYTLNCTGTGGSASQSATVTVTPTGSNPLNSLQPGQWYMAPNTNVSALDPCPARNCSYSGSDGQAHVMGAWNSGAYDTKRDRLIIWGGGHNNYGGNEIYTFDIATLSWARITEPSIVLPQDRADCFPAGVAGCSGGSNATGYYSDGKPASRHTANALAYAANVDQFFSLALGSSFGSTGRQGFDVDSFNFDTGTWKSDWQKSPGNPYGAAGTIAAYNPVTGKIWYHASMNSPLAEFDPTVSPTGSWRTSTVTTPNNGQAGVLMDYKRNRMVAIGEYGGSRVLRVWDLNNINTPPTNPSTSGAPGGIALESARGVGFIYDPVGDRYVAWHGGATVYALDPVTWVWSAIPLYSGNTVTPTAPNNEGTYGRMQYIPSKQAFILVNQTTENVYFFKLTNGAAPPPVNPPAPTVSLTASPMSVASNGETTLSWLSSNATSCTASGAWSGPRAVIGAQGISALTATSTFTLTCSGAGGSVSKSVTVTVAAGTPAPTVSLTANPGNVSSGGSSTLTWSSTNATSCTAGGAWSGNKTTSGSQSTGPLSASSTYTLNCTGTGGSASQSISISVGTGTPSPVGLITSVQMVNNSGGNLANAPVTFGHAFKQGDVPTGFTVIAKDNAGNPVALQVDKKATFADGSLRHAILTARLASLPAAATQTLSLHTQADSASGGAVSLANLLATSFDSQVSLNVAGVIYTASARDLLQTTTPKSWLAGPEVSEWIVGGPVKTASGVAHPHLAAYFHVRAYAGSPITKVRVDAVVENNWTFKSGATSFTYIPTVTVGNTVLYDNGGANLTHYHHTRWHQVGWWNNTDSKIFVKPDTRYLRDSKAVPNYANITPQASLLDGYTQTVVPLTIANLRPDWRPGAAHAQIGLMPEWYASYVMSDGDIRAYNAVLANDSAGGAFSYHYRDENTGLPVSIDTHPNISEQDPSSLVLGAGGNPNVHDAEHQPLIGYLGYLLTGDYYYLEELQFLANWGMLWHTAGNRGGSDGIIGGRGSPAGNREIAWAVRTQAAAGAISPDLGSFKSYFTAKANNNLNSMAAAWGATSPNSLGIRLDVGYFDAGYYAPWQMDFLVAVVNFAVDLGYSSTNVITLRNTFNKWPTGRMGQDNSGYCPYYAALYNFGNDVSDRGVINGGVYRTFAQLYQYKFPAESAQPCPTSGVMRTGYGGINSIDYYSNVLQVALAMAVDSGVATQATWNKFLSIAPADYSLGGTWAIVPRQ